MKKRKLPKDAVAIVTYKWDSDLQNYVLVKREPVKRQEQPVGNSIAGTNVRK